jgi:hypothetical protein
LNFNTTIDVKATDVHFHGDELTITLSVGRVLDVPIGRLEWLSWLAQATPEQRSHWHIEPAGFAIYWDDLNDGVEIRHLPGTTSLV